jgi:hypothetical protein
MKGIGMDVLGGLDAAFAGKTGGGEAVCVRRPLFLVRGERGPPEEEGTNP